MKKIWVWSALGVVAIAVLTIWVSMPVKADGGTQIFAPARFALTEAEINVAQLQGTSSSLQKVMFKIDTATGQVWALQLAVQGPNNPSVVSASWVPVANQSVQTPAPQNWNTGL